MNAVATALATGLMRMMGLFTGTVVEPATFSDIFDVTIIETLINLLKKLTHLFTIFPVNLLIIGSIVGIAFGLLRKAKRTATN